MSDRRRAELMAGQAELRAGRDPFEPSFDAGVCDSTRGRLFADGFLRSRHSRSDYERGWEEGRRQLFA